jgi:hypothetical protein
VESKKRGWEAEAVIELPLQNTGQQKGDNDAG